MSFQGTFTVKKWLEMGCDGSRRARPFQARGPTTAKARSPTVVRVVAGTGTMRSADDTERPGRWSSAGSSVPTRVVGI